ncbi:HEPN domain-containing protein [Bradyrhizobium guangzhouense]|uniref:HEPN domain-containing protein n=1 Tax=Bradyrhizobium guangzhouense TaxID=1325095 RepID=UPI001009EC81|nr:HEPN domain-containing protein [Bradyrhizobium guangzhouense]RXH05696.1 hypothetical protein EAS54_38990 [Bradyrhizobium guangzhouense]
MNSETAASEKADKPHGDVVAYMRLFRAAFDEFHAAVLEKLNSNPKPYLSVHHDYPLMSWLDSGFPSFRETGFYDSNGPKNYAILAGGGGLLAALGGGSPKPELPKGGELKEFLKTHPAGARLDLDKWDYPVDLMVQRAVERYFHLHGLDAEINPKFRERITRPLIFASLVSTLSMRLVVPIAMTHFSVDHFKLTETTYITRIPKKLQLARARMSTLGSGAVRMVVGAATHAFISNDWTLTTDKIGEARQSLGQTSSNVLDAIDSFFAALRVVTGVDTGYAQLLWLPRGWALDYFCDLPPVYGTTLRRYPDAYDNYGWTYRPSQTVDSEQLTEVRSVYEAILKSQSEGMRLALNRLNGCLTRTDAADAVLDGTIGLELLLGDDQNQSLSYKLRLRAAALAILKADPNYPAPLVAAKVKRLYEARSAIVHGKRKKRTKSASEPSDNAHAAERLIAADLLRFVLKVLLEHPEYQDPAKIDEGLLLRGDTHAVRDSKPKPTRRPRKAKT